VGGHYFITSAVKIMSTKGTKFHGNGHYLILEIDEVKHQKRMAVNTDKFTISY
jgi:hypothetical protein